jgi:hypothetical protein
MYLVVRGLPAVESRLLHRPRDRRLPGLRRRQSFVPSRRRRHLEKLRNRRTVERRRDFGGGGGRK